MDWTLWTPRERANLCFIRRCSRLLLIRKKRGIGAGKINAPGGKIEPGETALEAAIRETREEIGVEPIAPDPRGELHFQFADGYSLHCTVFLALDLHGEPIETAEATPFWMDVNALPYDEMWEDDRYWLPLLLADKIFAGFFTFEGDTMLTKQIEIRNDHLPVDWCGGRTKKCSKEK
jgi:8-oxo-dGTP diphosphatase